MPRLSEEVTKGIVSDKLKKFDEYPDKQNCKENGITWFKEDSYLGTEYDYYKDLLSKASKKQTYKDKGTPDFLIVKDDEDIVVIIETKGDIKHHSKYKNIKDYEKYGFGSPKETIKYAINGALWYATFLNDEKDVIAVSVSGQNRTELRITSFVLPKGKTINDIKLIEDGKYRNSLVTIDDYKKTLDIVLDRFKEEEDEVKRELRAYTIACANYLRSNGIEDSDKAGFVSAIVLGLTNHSSALFELTKKAIDSKNASKTKRVTKDFLGKNSIKYLKNALYGDGKKYESDYIEGVWDIDKIPEGKRISLKKFYERILDSKLLNAPKNQGKYFKDGDTVLSSCIYSLYENIIVIFEHYQGIDVMGEFYTTFLRFTKGNAKEKGIVLTPKHITEFFCDIAEYYGGKFNEKTKIIDICCGTGSFLISSLSRIKNNIYSMPISNEKKAELYDKAQRFSLIGVENDASMYALAYANMRFHGDGKSNLFNCSSLLSDSYSPVDEQGKTYFDEEQIYLKDALSNYGCIDFGMLNPPYSMSKNDDKDAKKRVYDSDDVPEDVAIQRGQDELDFIASMLHYLKKGGIGIALVPMSCAGNSGLKIRQKILEYHTLLACMTMPQNLFFDSHVGTATCIMVFKAHIPHDEDKSVFFARWIDDGFKVIPHNGRRDAEKWGEIRKQWIEQLDGTASNDDTIWLKKRIKISDEALAEAYIKTDYSKLTDDDFEKTLKKYSLFRFMDENGLMEE